MDCRTQRTVALGSAAAITALLVAAPTPVRALARLRDAGSAADPTAPLVAALSLLAWPLALWLAVTVVLTLAGRRSGRTGRVAGALARRVAPVAVRRAVEVALGLSVVVGGVAAPAVAATDGPAPAAGPAAAALDWAGTPAPGLDWPAAPDTSATSVRAAPMARAEVAGEVVVRPGDTLWDLAEQELAGRTGTSPTTAQVAAAWPSWWAANREAVGEDPHLIRPGTPLTPPAEPS